MERTATAEWRGGLKDGRGSLTTQSETLAQTPYSFMARFEHGPGTNPEELIAAAHAGCFAMALSNELGQAKLDPQLIRTTARVTLKMVDTQWTISASHLEVEVKLGKRDPAAFEKAANGAKAGCPVSRLMKATITMDAKLLE